MCWSSPVFVLVSKFKTPFQDFMLIIFHQGAIVRVIHTKARPQGLGSQMSCLRQWFGDFSMFLNLVVWCIQLHGKYSCRQWMVGALVKSSRSTTTCLAAPIQAASPRNSIRWARNWRHNVISTGLLLVSVEALKSRLGRHRASGCTHLINMEILHLSSVELSSLLLVGN